MRVHTTERQDDHVVLGRHGTEAPLQLAPLHDVADDGLSEIPLEDHVVERVVVPRSQRSRHSQNGNHNWQPRKSLFRTWPEPPKVSDAGGPDRSELGEREAAVPPRRHEEVLAVSRAAGSS